MSQHEIDLRMMQRALELARRGIGRVSPNPLVGCVLTDAHGNIIGEGAHEEFGGPHAEPQAIHDAETRGHSTEGATMFVTLEPHSFQGKTPPCTDLIIAKKIARCVMAMVDPNPRVAGTGIELLRQAGIDVMTGLLEDQAREQNRFFIKHITSGLPYVTLKIAMSQDGRSALKTGKQFWITSEASRRAVHAMRAQHDAILVGTTTALIDDPQLTVRFGEVARQPWRVVLDARNELPSTLKLFSDEHEERTIRITAEYVGMRGNGLDLKDVLKLLGTRGIASLLVEAGPTLAESIVSEDLFDEIVIFQAPTPLGEHARSAFGAVSLDDLRKRLAVTSQPVEGSDDILLRFRRPE